MALPYTVIGVGECQGKMMGQSMDNWVSIPLTAFLHAHGSQGSMSIFVNAGGGGEVMDAVSDELRVIMRARRHLAARRAGQLFRRYQRHLSEHVEQDAE